LKKARTPPARSRSTMMFSRPTVARKNCPGAAMASARPTQYQEREKSFSCSSVKVAWS